MTPDEWLAAAKGEVDATGLFASSREWENAGVLGVSFYPSRVALRAGRRAFAVTVARDAEIDIDPRKAVRAELAAEIA